MKIHPSTAVVPLAVVLLVGAAGAVLASSGGGAPASPVTPAAATATPGATSAPAPTAATTKPVPTDTALTTALDKLVADGTITAAQKEAILGAVTDEREARAAERKAQREALKAQREQVKGFLSDGVITQQEFNQLPADSPLRKLTTLMDDGEITTDELRELGRGLFLGKGHGHGNAFGPWFKGDKGDKADDAPAATATPAP